MESFEDAFSSLEASLIFEICDSITYFLSFFFFENYVGALALPLF